MLSETVHSSQSTTFFNDLKTLSDSRDNRGKRHNLAFILGASALAIMLGRARDSSIYRYIESKIDWLRQISQMPDANPISRAQLPRILAIAEWNELNKIIEKNYGVRITCDDHKKWGWIAIDGKTLRGATNAKNKHGERVVLAVPHSREAILAQSQMNGPKSSEITTVRTMLQKTGLEKAKITLDALHCNPKTTEQIHQANGMYLTQVKENQPTLAAQCRHAATHTTPVVTLASTTNKGHGRIETRQATLFALEQVELAERWMGSGLQTLIVMERKTVHVVKDKTSQETSYYITNQNVGKGQQTKALDLAQAIRGHWGVESDNWIRDVIFEEDDIKIKDGKRAQVMASLRTLAMSVFRKANVRNFQAAIETWTDCPGKFESMLRRVKFL